MTETPAKKIRENLNRANEILDNANQRLVDLRDRNNRNISKKEYERLERKYDKGSYK